MDDEADHAAVMESPVPHGLKTFPDSSSELLDFFGCDPLMMQAAVIGIPDFALTDTDSQQTAWLDSLTAAETKRIVERLMTKDAALLKAELVAGIRESKARVDWPCTAPSRTVAELIAQCEVLRSDEEVRIERKAAAKAKREAIKAERMRQERIQEMKADPKKWISKAEKLVDARGTDKLTCGCQPHSIDPLTRRLRASCNQLRSCLRLRSRYTCADPVATASSQLSVVESLPIHRPLRLGVKQFASTRH